MLLNTKTLLDIKKGFQEREKEKYTGFQIGPRLLGFGCQIWTPRFDIL
jgi:hypothetical protein